MANTSSTALVADFLERVWNLGQVDDCDEMVADHYRIAHDPGDPWDGRTLTREEFKERVRISRAPCPDQRFTVLHSAPADGGAFIAWTWTGSHLGMLGGIAPSGRVLEMSGMTFYFVENGKISGHWQVVDRLSVAKQLAA